MAWNEMMDILSGLGQYTPGALNSRMANAFQLPHQNIDPALDVRWQPDQGEGFMPQFRNYVAQGVRSGDLPSLDDIVAMMGGFGGMAAPRWGAAAKANWELTPALAESLGLGAENAVGRGGKGLRKLTDAKGPGSYGVRTNMVDDLQSAIESLTSSQEKRMAASSPKPPGARWELDRNPQVQSLVDQILAGLKNETPETMFDNTYDLGAKAAKSRGATPNQTFQMENYMNRVAKDMPEPSDRWSAVRDVAPKAKDWYERAVDVSPWGMLLASIAAPVLGGYAAAKAIGPIPQYGLGRTAEDDRREKQMQARGEEIRRSRGNMPDNLPWELHSQWDKLDPTAQDQIRKYLATNRPWW